MKLLFDANLAPRLAKRLAELYPGSAHVREFALQDDRMIWDFAAKNNFELATRAQEPSPNSLLLTGSIWTSSMPIPTRPC